MSKKLAIDFIVNLTPFVSFLFFIPQAMKIFRTKAGENVNVPIFLGFLLIQCSLILQGIINQNYLLTLGYILYITVCGALIILSLIYKKYQLSYISEENVSFKEILQQLPGHIYWKDKDGRGLGCNINNYKDNGLKSLDDYIGTTDYDLFSKQEADKLRQTDLEVMQTGQLKVIEESASDPSGKSALYLSHKVPLRNKNNKIVGILGTSLNITDTRKAEIERLELLENIIALMPGHVYWVNRDNVYLGCNNKQAKSAGLTSRKEIIGKRNAELPWNFNSGMLPETLDKINQEVMETKKEIMIEEPALLQDNTQLLFLSNKAPLQNSQGDIIGMVGISIDITEHRKIQQDLQETQHKLEGMTLVSASIAHEIRTPLATLDIGTGSIEESLPLLLETYELAKAAHLAIPTIDDYVVKGLNFIVPAMKREIHAAHTFIDMLLMNLNPELNGNSDEVFSIAASVNEALARYPFGPEQKERLIWIDNNDFLVKGKQMLVVHILFNLIKNALFYIGSKDNAIIKIWLERSGVYDKLYFEDTGTGISSNALPHVFDRFFSRTRNGAGVGLTYCKMVMETLSGKITCESEEGHYTQFILHFPCYDGSQGRGKQ